LKNCERYCYENLLYTHQNDMKKTWKTLNNLLCHKKKYCELFCEFTIDGIKVSNKKVIADKFNDYFVSIGSNLANSIIVRVISMII